MPYFIALYIYILLIPYIFLLCIDLKYNFKKIEISNQKNIKYFENIKIFYESIISKYQNILLKQYFGNCIFKYKIRKY